MKQQKLIEIAGNLGEFHMVYWICKEYENVQHVGVWELIDEYL